MYLMYLFISVLHTKLSLYNKLEAVDKSVEASRQEKRQDLGLKCTMKGLRM